MGKTHLPEEQSAFAWRQAESGVSVAGVIRKLGIAGLRRLRSFEEENRKLKQLVANLSLDKRMLQDVLSQKL